MPRRKPSLLVVARTGDRRATLEGLRDRLAAVIDEGPEPRDLAALSRRLEMILAELDGLQTEVEVPFADALAARRAAKKTAEG